ncbi:Ig-like domain-containing protein [Luteolibacter sp. Populi]|uniref:Ig-like domain-containing protein n=1 Tax=Luteolibacter sp. Populi TaxID=3230487 RepID=UPI003467EA2A
MKRFSIPWRWTVPLAVAWLAGTAGLGAAPLVAERVGGPNNPSTTTDELSFAADVSSTDLLAGISGSGGVWNLNGSSPDGLNDGNPGGDADSAGLGALSGAAWAKDGSNVSFREFVLGAGPGGLGYDLTGIQSIAAWQGAGFANQRYEVRVRLLGQASFQTQALVTVNYQPFSATTTEGGSTRVRVTDSTGILATGVDAIRFDVLDTTGNSAGGTVFREIDVSGTATAGTTDIVAPVVSACTPEDNAGLVPAGVNLTAVFHEPVVTGSGSITLKNTDTQQQTVIALPDPRVSLAGRTLTIRAGALLAPASHYVVRLGAGVVSDSSGNAFAGTADDTVWNFATAAPGAQEFSPVEMNFATEASASDLLQGITPLTSGWNTSNGASPVELSDGIHGRNFATAANTVDGAWTTVGAIAEYQLGAGSNGSGYDIFSIQSIAAWVNVAFGNQAWKVEAKPVGGSYADLATVNYQPLSGSGSTRVVMSGPGPLLASGVEALRFTANPVNGGANAGAFVWRELDVFGEPAGVAVDNGTPPAILSLSPADGATGVPPGTALVANFDESITAGGGSIRIRNLDTAQETVIPVGDPRVALAGNKLTISPAPKLAPLTRYALRIDAGAVQDHFAHAFAGISDDSTWNFTTGRTPLRIMPMGDSITAGYTDNPVWNEPYAYGYRSGLYNRLHAAGYDSIFVGQSSELLNHTAGTPPASLAALGQNAHNGYGGQTASFLNQNILNWLAVDNPDVILLKIGTNSQDSNGLNALVQTITTTRPECHVIVAEIMPKYNYEQGIVNYNAWIRQTLVPTFQAQGKKVTRVDQYAPFLTNPANLASINQALFSNGINHPDNDGYDRMAEVWFEGIEALGLNSLSYGEWIADPAYGIAQTDRGLLADPDGDGLANAVEAYLGTDPGHFSPGLVNLSGSGAGFSFSHSLNARTIAGLTGTYEWSPDLAAWYEADGVAGPAGGLKVTCTPTPGAAGVAVQAVASEPVKRVFLRLSVGSP